MAYYLKKDEQVDVNVALPGGAADTGITYESTHPAVVSVNSTGVAKVIVNPTSIIQTFVMGKDSNGIVIGSAEIYAIPSTAATTNVMDSGKPKYVAPAELGTVTYAGATLTHVLQADKTVDLTWDSVDITTANGSGSAPSYLRTKWYKDSVYTGASYLGPLATSGTDVNAFDGALGVGAYRADLVVVHADNTEGAVQATVSFNVA